MQRKPLKPSWWDETEKKVGIKNRKPGRLGTTDPKGIIGMSSIAKRFCNIKKNKKYNSEKIYSEIQTRAFDYWEKENKEAIIEAAFLCLLLISLEERSMLTTKNSQKASKIKYKKKPLESRMGLIDPIGIQALSQVSGMGAQKYSPFNFMGQMIDEDLFSAAQRHLNLYLSGENKDRESDLPHLAHAAWHFSTLFSLEERELLLTIRPWVVNIPRK